MVVMYTTSNCSECNNAKKMLTLYNVAFEEILATDDILADLKAKGFRSFPVISENGSYLSGSTSSIIMSLVKTRKGWNNA